MTPRRTFLLGGAGVAVLAVAGVGLERAGRADDVADALGIDPVPIPDPGDERLLAGVAADTARLLALAGSAPEPVRSLLADQVRACGPAQAGAEPAVGPEELRSALTEASEERARQTLDAVSPALARTLAALSAGLGVAATLELA